MAESSNIARPYARAVFELAQQQDDLAGWHDRLQLLAAIAADAGVAAAANNPRVSAEQLRQLILEVAADRLNADGVNLVKLLVRNGRIGILPAIAAAYAARRAEAERVIAAVITTAAETGEPQRKRFEAALQAKLGRKVELAFEVDHDLIGGAKVRAGDWVIDGSVRAQLEQLVGALSA